MPDSPSNLSPAELTRYSRHILLGEIGVEGQRKIAAARVLVIGAGGLRQSGGALSRGRGRRHPRIADFDEVAAHNLQRQLLHDDAAVGESK